MLIWLKDSLRNDSIMVKPFIWSLFYWRPKEGHIPINKQQDLLEKGVPQALLRSYINYHYKKCFFSWSLYIICSQFLQLYTPNVSDIPYPIRVIRFFYDGTPFISLFNLFHCYIYTCGIFFSMNYCYEVTLIPSAHLLSFIYSTQNSFLHTKLTKDQLDSLKLWLISLLYSNPIFNHPYLSKSPKDLWSNRWHQILNAFFVEIGYKPTCYLLSFTPIKIQKFFGILAAFTISGILHEYILYTSNKYFTLEQLTYFLFHAIVMIIWEVIMDSEEKKTKEMKVDQKHFLKEIRNILFMTIFVVFTLPWFIEPYIRCEHYNTLMHFIKRN